MKYSKTKELEEMDRALDSLSVWCTEFTFGWRLKHIRNKRKLTQKELGLICGFPEKGADLRIRQYESNLRHPKENILQIMSTELQISPEMLLVKSNDLQTSLFINILWTDIVGLIDVFDAENKYEFFPDNIYKIKTSIKSNVPGIVPNNEGPLIKWISALHEKHQQYETGYISIKELRDWEYLWPQCL